MAKGFKKATGSLGEEKSKETMETGIKFESVPEVSQTQKVTGTATTESRVKLGKGFAPASEMRPDSANSFREVRTSTEEYNRKENIASNEDVHYNNPLPKPRKKRRKTVLIAAVIAVAFLGVGIGGKVIYEKSTTNDSYSVNEEYDNNKGVDSEKNLNLNEESGDNKGVDSEKNQNSNGENANNLYSAYESHYDNKGIDSKKNLNLNGEIPCSTKSYVSNDFGFSYEIPSDFTEEGTERPGNGTEITQYIGKDAEGNDITICVYGVTKEKGMQNVSNAISSLLEEGVNVKVDNSDSLVSLEKKIWDAGLDFSKSEVEKSGYITEVSKKGDSYVISASLPSEENDGTYEDRLVEKGELYDNGKTAVVQTNELIKIDSDNEIEKHGWQGAKEIDCGNYIKSIIVWAETDWEEDINPSISKLKYILNQFN